MIEAMAFGKPIITTRHVEIPRIINEILVDENDVQGLSEAILQVYLSASLRRRLGEKSRHIAEEIFSTGNAGRAAWILSSVAKQQKRERLQTNATDYRPESTEEDAEVTLR